MVIDTGVVVTMGHRVVEFSRVPESVEDWNTTLESITNEIITQYEKSTGDSRNIRVIFNSISRL